MWKVRSFLSQQTIGGTIRPLLCCLLITFFSPTSQAYGVQEHGGAEGLVSHQLGHLLFTFAMVTLLLRWSKSQLTGPGWYEFRGFLWLVVFWNLLTFTGHWLRENIVPESFIHHEGHVAAFQIDTFVDLVFYLTQLEPLLLIPAFFLLLLAIQKWGHSK